MAAALDPGRPGPKRRGRDGDDREWLEGLFTPDEDDPGLEDENDDGPPVHLNSRRSVELFNLSRLFPGVPVFPGAITDWPTWFIEDYRTLNQFEARARKEKRDDQKREAWAEKVRQEMRAEARKRASR